MRVLITGATGLLGNNVARLAIQQGLDVITVSRTSKSAKSLADLSVEHHSLDLSDASQLDAMVDGPVDAVIHCAAHIHIGWKFLTEAMAINRDGTRSICEFAQRRGARMIHVSTVNTLAIGASDSPADEETPGDGQVPCTYVLSKRAAESVVIESAARGQDIVIVHPGFMLGPWDWKPSSGRMIVELSQHFTPLAPSGGCSVCDPRDVAAAILNAIRDGQSGRHYVLAGSNMSYLDLWSRICKALKKRSPWTYMRFPARFLGSHVGDFLNRFLSGEMDINSAAIRMSSQFHYYSSQRAISELGYRPRSVDESISDAVEWFREHKILTAA